MNKNTPDAPQSPESASESPVAAIVDGTRSDIRIVTAEQLIGPFDMECDPALIALGVAKRHGGYGLEAAIRGTSSRQPTFDEETDAEFQAGLAEIR